MTVRQLIELAKTAGYGIGRYRSRKYYYLWSDGKAVTEVGFDGTWEAFAKFVQELVAKGPAPGRPPRSAIR